jgi:hypothetical protein
MSYELRPVKEGTSWCPLCKHFPNGDHYCPTDHPLWSTVQAMHDKIDLYPDDGGVTEYNIGVTWLSAANMLQGDIFKQMNEGLLDNYGYIKDGVVKLP